MTESWKYWEGQEVDGFPLRRYLGGSDHSAVYSTDLAGSESRVAAIKIIYADPGTAEAQLARWRVAAALSHPALLRILHLGRWQSGPENFLYAVMEPAEEDLSQILPERALEPAEARQVLESVLDALVYLHGKGLVHSRLGPSNILAAGEHLKIASDTLRQVGEAPDPRRPVGRYDAPETAKAAIHPAADVWSLGATLVEVLTQKRPELRAGQEAVPVAETLPEPFLQIARHSLLADPTRRWSAGEIAEHLNPAQKVSAPPIRSIAGSVESPLSLPGAKVKPLKTAVPIGATSPAVGTSTIFAAPPRKSRAWIPVLAVVLVLAAILAAPRMMNRHSQLQPDPVAISTPGPDAAIASAPLKPAAPDRVPEAASGSNAGRKKSSEPTPAPQNTALRTAVDKTPSGGDVKIPASSRPSSAAAKTDGNIAPDSSRGSVLYQVVPDVSQRARDTIRGKVRVTVRVQVDPAGSVTSAELDGDGASHYFSEQAVDVTKRWIFTPPEVDGRGVASDWLVRFEFSPTDTKVFPSQTRP